MPLMAVTSLKLNAQACRHILCYLPLCLLLLPDTQAQLGSDVETLPSNTFAHSVTFNYVMGAWRVLFTQAQQDTAQKIYIPQTCRLNDANDEYCNARDIFDIGNYMSCSEMLQYMQQSHWQNSFAQANNTICSTSIPLGHKQELHSSTDGLMMLNVAPLSVLITPNRNILELFAHTTSQSTYTLEFRLLVVEFIDASLVHAAATRVNVTLHQPTDSAEILLENSCTARGLISPRHGMLVSVTLRHGSVACITHCNWRHIPVPWNAAVQITADTGENTAAAGSSIAESTQFLSRCVPLPPQFTATSVHIDLQFTDVVSAALLSQEALDAVDALARGIQNNSVNVSNGMVVCRVPSSYSAGREFDFIMHKFSNDMQEPGYTLETRQRNIASTASVDELLHAECLLVTTDLLEPIVAEETVRAAVQRFSQQIHSVIPVLNYTNKLTITNLTLGDYHVVSVTRRAQTTVTVPPRIHLDLQRFGLIALQVLVVVATATAIAGRNA